MYRWNIKQPSQNFSSYKRKDGDENGSRIYQTMLNSMQLLPITDIHKITTPSPPEVEEINPTSSSKRKKPDNINTNDKARKKRNATTRNSLTTTKINTRSGDGTSASGSKNDIDTEMSIV